MKVFSIKDKYGAARRFESGRAIIYVGRGSGCDLKLEGSKVSSDHGYFKIEGDVVSYYDRSMNGSYVNGEHINNVGRRLSPGDTVELWGDSIKYVGSAGAVSRVPTEIQSPVHHYAPPRQPREEAVRPQPQQNIQQHVNVSSPSPAMYKSYTGWSCLIFFLYIFIWPLGLILNLIYLSEANRIEKVSGVPPEGKGCLVALLIWQLIGLAITIIAVILLFMGILSIPFLGAIL